MSINKIDVKVNNKGQTIIKFDYGAPILSNELKGGIEKTYGYLIMNQDALDTLIYMNLKGPQIDTISFFLF